MTLVKLYYLGGLAQRKSPQDGSNKPIQVTTAGKAFTLPEVGDYIEVSNHEARNLMRRNKVTNSSGTFEVFTLDRSLAAKIQRGALQNEVPVKRDYSVEELKEMLQLAQEREDLSKIDQKLQNRSESKTEEETELDLLAVEVDVDLDESDVPPSRRVGRRPNVKDQ